jgi:glycosyltransferase 2 family protein
MPATKAIELRSAPSRHLPGASLLAGAVVSVLFLWLAGRNVEWSGLWDHLRHVRVVPLIIGVAAALGAFVSMAYRWHALLDGTAQVSVADTFDFTVIGFLAGLVMPQRLGDIVKVVVLARRAGASRTSVLATVVLERLSDVVMLLALAATFAITVKLPILLTASMGVLAAVAVSALIVLRFTLSFTSRFLSTARRFLPSASIGALEAQASKLEEGLHAIKSGSHFLTALLMAALVWGLSGLSMSAYVAAFGLAVPWYAGYLVILLTNLGGILPSSPGSIGVYHYMTVLALSTWTQDRTAALTFAFVTHALTMLLIVSTGLWGLARQGLSWRAVRDTV